MPSYRFCRPDDLALIAQAINACYLIHYPDEPVMTPERLKEQMTLFQVRPGNCMVALENHQPVGTVISTKRDYGTWIQALGCQAAVQRDGVASQLLEALIRKITIQRSPDISVDVPADNVPAVACFEKAAFTVRARYVSFQGTLAQATNTALEVTAVPASELLAFYAQCHVAPACWERNLDTLTAYGDVPQGYAYRTGDTLHGYLLHRDAMILDLAIAPQADADNVSAALLGRMHAAGFTHATLAKVPDDDPLCAVLRQRGFSPTGAYLYMGQRLN